ncbi:MAG TPA: type II toxin-antitoxin system VapC family toxin [Chloroflexota bacterium]|nr:type II toxin-antitoxin system VapC family toxin [Chloroflexota bacterium]
MVVDASVWVGRYVPEDVHHAASLSWFSRGPAQQSSLAVPFLALAEVAGAIARRTGHSADAQNAVEHMRAVPGLQMVPLEESLAVQAAQAALSYRLRGADAVYVAVALRLSMPLVTFDNELAERARAAVEVIQPA